jgi:phage terminase large subunit GpA-like protein
MSRIYAVLQRAIVTALVIREKLNLWQWSDKHVTLESSFSARPGRYDSSYTAYLRGPMEALSDRRIRQVTIVKGAQIGFTTMLANWIMYLVDMDPGPTMLAQPSRKIVRRYVKKELHPRFLKCKQLEKYIPLNRKEKFTTEEMYFTSMDFFATGVGSPALLASLPIKNAAGDEIDKWEGEDEKEASRKDLLTARQITYEANDTSKLALGSTPTTPEMTISVEATKGSQERFHVPCPECGHKQELRFENFDWKHVPKVRKPDGSYDLDLVKAGTAIRCDNPDCNALIPQNRRQWMIRRGEWIAQNPNAPSNHRSFYVAGEYGMLTPGMLAVKFLELQHLPGGLHHFYNSYLGRAWERKAGGATKKSIELIQAASPKYNLGHPEDRDAELVLPFRPIVLTMHVDVQQLEFYWTMRAWMLDGSRAVIGLGTCVSYTELVDISNRVWKFDHNDGGPLEEFTMWTGLMDSGYKAKATTGVYNFEHEQGGRWIVTKGGKYAGGKDYPISETRVPHNIEGGQIEVVLIHYTDTIIKEHLYRFVIKERRQPPYWLPQDLPADFIEQITAERLVPKKNAEGRTELKWHSEIDPHFGDCEKIGEIFAFMLHPELRAQIRAKQDTDRASLLDRLKVDQGR